MKTLLYILLFINILFASPQNSSQINTLKKLIQKEEFISLAVNKYILQTGKLPIDSNNNFDWNKLLVDDYLGLNFNKKNPFTSNDIIVTFDENKNAFIKGILETQDDYNTNDKFLYNFYINRIFRVNTLTPKTVTNSSLANGSQIIYAKSQKNIVSLLNDNKNITLDSQKCPTNNFFYELKNNELTYKYCREDYSFPVYQTSPIFLKNKEDLAFIKAKIGDRAYAKNNGSWYEYYYQGNLDIPWIPVDSGSFLNSQNDNIDIEDRIISYIPNSKDLIIRKDGGCMLANGDIFCWGDNTNKKAGIHTKGQLNPNLNPDFVNTPVMLKVQIDDETRNSKKWFNNPYRQKFEKVAYNKTNVCGVSPIFDYFQAGNYVKFGGDVFCNGSLHSDFYEDVPVGSSTTSILKRNKFFVTEKNDKRNNSSEIYIKDIAMADGVTAVLSDDGKIYTYGSNSKGALGIDDINENTIVNPTALLGKEINLENQIFKKLFVLRDIKCFGALDSNNNFWMWGERPNGTILYKPTLFSSSLKFDENAIFVNNKDFVLKGIDKNFYRTYASDTDVKLISSIPNTALSASIFDDENNDFYLYVSEKRQLVGSSLLINCNEIDNTNCLDQDTNIFNQAIAELNQLIPAMHSQQYASFSNVSIYGTNSISTSTSKTQTINLVDKDFEDGNLSGWSNAAAIDGNSITGKYLRNNTYTKTDSDDSAIATISKKYTFGKSNANKKIDISFDLYEIDNWDDSGNYLKVILTGDTTKTYNYEDDTTDNLFDPDDYVEANLIAPLDYSSSDKDVDGNPYQDVDYDEKHAFNYTDVVLDLEGNFELKFVIYFDDYYKDANKMKVSWGIDNLKITTTQTIEPNYNSDLSVCAMTGLGSQSQMYCWGKIGRSLPILNTSLYDDSKVTEINKMFVTQTSEKNSQLSFDEFNNDGSLFLKYPTYIGGFDYEFYFK